MPICPICGEEFVQEPHKTGPKRKYCSLVCAYEALCNNVLSRRKQQWAENTDGKFRKDAIEYQRQYRKKKKEENPDVRVCAMCGLEFTLGTPGTGRKFCSPTCRRQHHAEKNAHK